MSDLPTAELIRGCLGEGWTICNSFAVPIDTAHVEPWSEARTLHLRGPIGRIRVVAPRQPPLCAWPFWFGWIRNGCHHIPGQRSAAFQQIVDHVTRLDTPQQKPFP